MFTVFSELHCPSIPSWMGAELNTTDTLLDTYVNVTCPNAMTTSSGDTSQVIRCVTVTTATASAEWQPDLAPCQQPAVRTQDLVPTESEDGENIGMITLVICGAAAVIIVILDIPTIVMQLQRTWSILKDIKPQRRVSTESTTEPRSERINVDKRFKQQNVVHRETKSVPYYRTRGPWKNK